MQKPDAVRLRHMLEAARDAVSFARGRTRQELDQDRMFAFALVRCIEVIGEAAARVSSETKAGYASIPWAHVIGMRNWLIHAYFDISLDRLWDTITDDLPPLIAELEKLPLQDAEG